MGRQERQREIRRRRTHRQRLAKLRKRYTAAKTDAERSQVLGKLARVAPSLSQDVFLAPLKAEKPAT